MMPFARALGALLASASVLMPVPLRAADAPDAPTFADVGPYSRLPRHAPRRGGFTMMEVLIALAVVAILAALAVPALQDVVVRDQVVNAAPLADLAKKAVAASWAATQTLPADNAAAGLPAADRIVNNYVRAVTIRGGVIDITFGNNANSSIAGKILTMRPAVVDDAPVVPVAWVCGHAQVPGGMTVRGQDATDLPPSYLPVNCRA